MTDLSELEEELLNTSFVHTLTVSTSEQSTAYGERKEVHSTLRWMAFKGIRLDTCANRAA